MRPSQSTLVQRRNGLGSPFGIETPTKKCSRGKGFCRNGLGSPFGIETAINAVTSDPVLCRNGLGSPFGIETSKLRAIRSHHCTVGMAWEARSGLKLGFHQGERPTCWVGMAWEARSRIGDNVGVESGQAIQYL